MTIKRFCILSLLWFSVTAQAQTGIAVNQVVCPASSVPVVAVAMPPAVGGSKQSRFACISIDAKSFTLDTSTNPPTLRSAAQNFVDGEVPTGVIDGTNTIFTIVGTPAAGSLKLYRNGVRQSLGADFTLSGKTVTFASGAQPLSGDTLVVDYRI